MPADIAAIRNKIIFRADNPGQWFSGFHVWQFYKAGMSVAL
jgi:hypothetical protein